LKPKMALFGLTCAAAGQGWTTNPAQFEGDSVAGDLASLDGVGKVAQSFCPAETVEDVDP
jgi:hypothetical protein